VFVNQPVPPAVFRLRRATDRYMAVGFVAAALFMSVLVVRLAMRADWASVVVYVVPAALMIYAAVGMTRLLFKHWERRPAPAAAPVPAEDVPEPRSPAPSES
jgi:hypothetical protein